MTHSTMHQQHLQGSNDLQRHSNINQHLFGLLPNLSNKLSTNYHKVGHGGPSTIHLNQVGHAISSDNVDKDHASGNVSLPVLPKLVDEDKFFSVSNRFRRTPPSSSRSVEMVPSRFEGRLRPRASSFDRLPSLQVGSLKTDDDLISLNSSLRYSKHDTLDNSESDSDHTDDDGDADTKLSSPIVSIDPFPNVGVESFLQQSVNEIMLKPRAPTPPRKNSKKKKKKPAADSSKKRVRKRARKRLRNSQQTAASKWRDQEAARRYPIRKQFLYSELIDEELKSYIPKRKPGGKLKPIYKRNNLGEIYVPETLEIAFEKLASGMHEKETAETINKKRKEELQALLQRRTKLLGKQSKKKRKRVRFRLPKDHIPTDSSDDESIADAGEDDSTRDDENLSEDHANEKESVITNLDTEKKEHLGEYYEKEDNVLEGVRVNSDPRKSDIIIVVGQDN
ncbi:uncharacterized protein [Amphiura filiformis]|uniref:uncharacterized protein n=1 Tax=Amphiura filiformis TaxID=82378 RepID=UPI003B20C1EA